MTVHLIKLCVGVDSVEHLARLQAARLEKARRENPKARPTLRHVTRSTPRRAEELLGGGSLYWVIRGAIRVRQRVVAIETAAKADGTPACGLVLDAELVATEPRLFRAFQGWRYLDAGGAPADAGRVRSMAGEALPPEMAAELRVLGLL
jgi:hypothetical protein